ncbi:MAG: hypothetical protein ACJ8GN_23040 [Longimicrobiaceae bacterium]
MRFPFSPRTLPLALAAALLASTAAAQRATVHYAWLDPASGTANDSMATMLALSCPQGDAGPAYLSVVQPGRKAISRTPMNLLDWNQETGLFAELVRRNWSNNAALIRNALDAVIDLPVGQSIVHFSRVEGVATVSLSPQALARVPGTVKLAASCPNGLPERGVGAVKSGSDVDSLVVAGDYVFAFRPHPGPNPSALLENAIASFLMRLDTRSRASETCPALIPGSLLAKPLLETPEFADRKRQDLVKVEPDGRAWSVINGSPAERTVPRIVQIGTAFADTGEETLPPCATVSLTLNKPDRRFRQDSANAEFKDGRLVVSIIPRGHIELQRQATIKSSDGQITVTVARRENDDRRPRVDRNAVTDTKSPLSTRDLLYIVLAAGIAAGLGAAGGVAAGRRSLRQKEPDLTRASPRVAPEEIRNPVGLAFALRGLSGQDLSPILLELRNSIPNLRAMARYKLPESAWRRVLWQRLAETDQLKGLYYRATRKPWGKRALRWPLRPSTQVEREHGLSPDDEVRLLFQLKQDILREELGAEVQACIDRFPADEAPSPWLPQALAVGIGTALGRTALTRETLAHEIPDYFVPATGAGRSPQDEVVRKLDLVLQHLQEWKPSPTGDDTEGSEEDPATAELERARRALKDTSAERDRLRELLEAAEAEVARLTNLANRADPETARLRKQIEELEEASDTLRSQAERLQGEAERYRQESEHAHQAERSATLDRDAKQREIQAWENALRSVASTPDEADARVREWLSSAERAAELNASLAEASAKLRALTDADAGESVVPERDGAHTASRALALALERTLQRLEALYRAQRGRIFGARADELAPARGTAVLERLERLERESARLDQARIATPRAERIPLLFSALAFVGEALERLAAQSSPLDGSDLAPHGLAPRVRDMSETARTRWRDALFATLQGDTDPSLEFLAWLLGSRQLELLTQLLRLREVIAAYLGDGTLRGAEGIRVEGQRYAQACDALVQCVRGVGVYLDPVRFLQPPPDESAHFEMNSGRPLLLKTATLHEIVVTKVRSAPVELARTVADVSDWGYECPDLPYSPRPTRGWLCGGLGTL